MIPRLKSLELHGYKTFASRTLFEFPGIVTAIVGPNGSGKSNIADSLRWVLGEQSYSLLRGRKTEDMIFSGSEQRPRAGMASATITFFNEDGWLPIDFNEVAITRRAYRDGQNEYLLNGQRVRLKEISELLGKSGLAERTYTIIGQGLVDAALSLKPEERRRFFEEAAGIGLYRSRREESLTRLDTTRRNLERVLDIINELEPRLNSLEKQARRAQEYERIQADLRLLLRDWYGYHWRKTQQDLQHAREVLHAQEERLESARNRQMEVEAQLGEIRARVQELRLSLGDWHSLLSERHARWEKVSRALAVMDERRSALLSQQQNLDSDKNRLEEELEAQQGHLRSLIEEHRRLNEELADSQLQAAQARKSLQTRLAERGKIDQATREARRMLVASETAQVRVKAHQNELKNRIDVLVKSKQSLQNSLEKDTENLSQAQDQLNQQIKLKQAAEVDVKIADEAYHAHRNQSLVLETRRKKLQDDRLQIEAQLTRLTSQLDVLKQADQTLSGLADGAKFIVQEARRGRLKGNFHPLSGYLIVPAQYEVAIAAGLNELMDGIFLDQAADLAETAERLAKGENGRAVLLPLSSTRISDAIITFNDPDCLGSAADLVTISNVSDNKDLVTVLTQLLSQIWIVRDRTAAIRMQPRLVGLGRLVTLQGEVFISNGAVVAGRNNRSTTISRPRKIQETQIQLAELKAHHDDLQVSWSQVEGEIKVHREKELNLEQTRRQASNFLSQTNQSYQQAVLTVEQVQQRIEFHNRQLSGIDDQVQRSEQEFRQDQDEIEKHNKKINALNQNVREYTQALAQLPLDEFQTQEVHWNTAAAVAERAVKDADRRLSEHRELIETTRRQIETIKTRLSGCITSLEKLSSEQEESKQEAKALDIEIQDLQTHIGPAEQDLAQAEKVYAEQQSVLVSVQQAVSVADRYVSQAQLEYSRVRESLESLRRRIEDDFGLVAFAYNPEALGQTPLPMEGVVEQLPDLVELSPEIEDSINRQRAMLRRIGAINPEAQVEYQSVRDRYDFLTAQVGDLKKADADLREVISELDELIRQEFRKTFDAVAIEFRQLFTRLFGGGSARLILSEGEDPIEAGIDIEARLPGRREQGLSLLSGGERSLTAVALIFSLLKVSPTPFCVLDEVDAMLDEANVGRFRDLLLELSNRTQFILVTHNRNTVQAANVIYGVTMGRDSASQVISLRLDEINDEMVR